VGCVRGCVRLQAVAALSEAEATSTRDDPELRAMLAMVRYFEPLNRAACRRVLAWAEKRFTQLDIDESDLSAFASLTESLLAAAREIGDVTPQDIIRFADAAIEAKAEPNGA
jgi:hypothetical protein